MPPDRFNLREALNLTLVISRREASPRSIFELAEAAFKGGVTSLQLREKTGPDREIYQLACELAAFCRARKKFFTVNDRADIAIAAGADGLHLGQNDLPAEAAAALIPKSMILGLSVSTLTEAKAAVKAGADYLGLGAIIATDSKDDAKIIKSDQISAIIATRTPAVAIGGISAANCQQIRALGFDGLAVISALAKAEDPEAVARILAGRS
ncbi:MAG: thiamine phosphate synthase [Deltaproteobacteria bacterium]|nr:thiamine phosphate synthase [Deltaproteobacteria bacterium]